MVIKTPFRFLFYLQPTNYFRLAKKTGFTVFPIVRYLPKEIVNQLEIDDSYENESAKFYDMSWQAIQLGYIRDTKTYKNFDTLSLRDEYRFIRKYFNQAWVIYALFIRIVTLNNPLKEIRSFLSTRNTKKKAFFNKPIKHEHWFNFDSDLIKKKPKVSIIIPTLNRYNYLKHVLKDLENQDYINFEVIIIDQSEPLQKDFYSDFNLKLNLVFQNEKALWLARNTGIKKAKSNYLLFFDDDSRVDSDWISNHLKCLDFFKSDLSSGVSISIKGAKVPSSYNFFRLSQQLDTGNVLVKRDVFVQVGMFDRQFEKQRMGDGEFGLRCYLNGYLNVSNPYAKRLHLKVNSGGLREMGSWDAFRTNKIFAPRPIPSVLYFYRKYFGKKAALLNILKSIPPSILPYRFKKYKATSLIGLLLILFLWPFLTIQVYKSWRKSTEMLRRGALIPELNSNQSSSK